MTSALPGSEHFELVELEAGVYAALGKEGSGAYSNAGIIDLGDRTLVFDSFMTPQAAADLRAAVEQLTGRAASAIIISHAHSDHWMGNQVFDAATPIIASRKTRTAMPNAAAWLRELGESPEEMDAWLAEERGRLEAATDPLEHASLVSTIRRLSHLQSALSDLEFRLPNQVVDGNVGFHGSKRIVELVLVEPGHTSSDAYLLLPEERILFLGDLGFFQSQPFMAYCDPEAWMAQCRVLQALDVEVYVPGHGPLGTALDLEQQRQYIDAILAMLEGVISDGGFVEDALEARLPPPFAGWIAEGPARWEANVLSMYERPAAQ